MRTSQVVASAVVAVAVFWMVGAYNRLVRLRNAIAGHFAQADALLRQRHELLEQAAALAGPHMAETPEVAETLAAACQQARAAAEVARVRPVAAGAVTSLALAEQVLHSATARLMSALEASASLMATPGLGELIETLREADTKLGFARQVFNDSVIEYNSAAQQFPTHLLANMFGFRAAATL